MTAIEAAVVPEELKVYMSVSKGKDGWSWMAMAYLGGVSQSGFASKAEARAAAESQTFKPGLVKVWAD